MNIFPGKMVLYIWRPGQVRARQSESAAMITRVNPDGTVNLSVYPDGTPDALFLRNVAVMSEAVQCHCWKPNPDDEERERKSAANPAAAPTERKPRKAA